MKGPYRWIRLAIPIFKGLAWVSLAVNVVLGFVLLIFGGPDVLVGNFEVPARIVGMFNWVQAVVLFFTFSLASNVLQLLADLRESGNQPSGARS